MTINGGRPHRVGYSGQKYRIVVSEERDDGSMVERVLGWTNDNAKSLFGLTANTQWHAPRYVEVPSEDGYG
jgi:hypothetical protein